MTTAALVALWAIQTGFSN